MSDELNRVAVPPTNETPPATHVTIDDYLPTPISISPRTRNLIILAIVVALVLVIRAAPTILTISLGGGFLALILSFPVRLLSKIMPRGLAILLALLTLILGIILIFLIIVPVMINQLTDLIEAIPELTSEGERLLRDAIEPLQERGLMTEDSDTVIEDVRNGVIDRASLLAQNILAGIVGAITGIIGIAITMFAIVFVAVYLLIDIGRIRSTYLRIMPATYRRDALDLWDRFAFSLSRYLGGLAISLFVQGALSFLALWWLGVPYALLLGMWVSLTAIIPYLGAFLGAVPAVMLAFVESPTTGVLTVVLYIVIQQLESNALTPRIQGQAVRVHPILVLLTVLAASEIDGLRGAIFAVPALAVIRVLVDFFAARLRVQP